jgi:hypothetical protein
MLHYIVLADLTGDLHRAILSLKIQNTVAQYSTLVVSNSWEAFW